MLITNFSPLTLLVNRIPIVVPPQKNVIFGAGLIEERSWVDVKAISRFGFCIFIYWQVIMQKMIFLAVGGEGNSTNFECVNNCFFLHGLPRCRHPVEKILAGRLHEIPTLISGGPLSPTHPAAFQVIFERLVHGYI